MTTENKTLVFFYHERINKKLADMGYSHRIGLWQNGNRFQIYLKDITGGGDYHSREYGNMTLDKAVTWLRAYDEGLGMGLMTAD